MDLPSAFGSPDWNGGLAGPTLANIDDDADLEVVINTAHSGVVAYDLPGTANASHFMANREGQLLSEWCPGRYQQSLYNGHGW